MHPHVKNVVHFTDGAASQYKTCKNFANLLFHKDDFGVEGEWPFFATSHGKGPCDGIWGTVKRLARRASLQNEITIQTPLALFSWCNANIKNIKSFFVSSDDISTNEEALSNRFKNAKTLFSFFLIFSKNYPLFLFSMYRPFSLCEKQYSCIHHLFLQSW